MENTKAKLSWLEKPDIFAINRLEAYSSHKFYASQEEYQNKETSLKQSLNGLWKFSYAQNPENAALPASGQSQRVRSDPDKNLLSAVPREAPDYDNNNRTLQP